MTTQFAHRPTRLSAPLIVSNFSQVTGCDHRISRRGHRRSFQGDERRLSAQPVRGRGYATAGSIRRCFAAAIPDRHLRDLRTALSATRLNRTAVMKMTAAYVVLSCSGGHRASRITLRSHFIRHMPAVSIITDRLPSHPTNVVGLASTGADITATDLTAARIPAGIDPAAVRARLWRAVMIEASRLADPHRF